MTNQGEDHVDPIDETYDEDTRDVEELRRRIVLLREEIVELTDRISEKDRQIAALQKRVMEQGDAIKGFESWVRARRDNCIETYELGTLVQLKERSDIKGRIDNILLGPSSVQYKVGYWVGKQRLTIAVAHADLLPDEDILPPNSPTVPR